MSGPQADKHDNETASGRALALAEVSTYAREVRELGANQRLFDPGASRLVRLGLFLVGSLLTALITWAATTQLGEVAVAPGEVVTSGQVRTIQHLEGGILSEVLIKEGQIVSRGDVIARFDGTSARSELERVLSRRASLRLRAERLAAATEGREPDFGQVSESYQTLARAERAILFAKRNALEIERGVLKEQLEQRKLELDSLNSQNRNLTTQGKLLREEVAMREKLFKQDHGSKLLLIKAEHTLAQAEGERTRVRGSIRTALAAVREFERRLSELDLRWQTESLEELGKVKAELSETEETIAGLSDRVRRLDILSPIDGVVQHVPLQTERGVLPPGGVIAEIVPSADPLIVEARISTSDIGFVSAGQPVIIKVQTFNFARFGSVQGVLESVSATTFETPEGQPFYKGRVKLSKQFVGDDPEDKILLPGMTVQADINTGEKSLMAYILKPIYTNLDESFRER